MQHTAKDIVDCIRATDPDGSFVLSGTEASLMVTLFASVAATKAERDLLNPAPVKARQIVVGDHAPELVRS